MSVKLGLPSKGRLMADAAAWLTGHGIALERNGSEREYSATIQGVEGVEPVLLAAAEIPRELAAGRIHLGITGIDVVRDRLALWDRQTECLAELGFGRADLVLAVPTVWVDVDTLDDLDAAAAQFRRTHGFRLRIATKYHRLVREFLADAGVADYQLVDSQGATEGTVRNLTAEAIADITTTGATMRANGLKPLADGTILKSQAALFASRVASWDDNADKTLKTLKKIIGI